ncbi:hypothetical protein Scep_024388 [Stephania cephalantha]|uniref:Cupin type-1 domain-containing protein n=1 Tax=Stephania cephalantha TaxID=152367 RepID=A0AAP0F3M3_9MAGN
MLSAVFVNGKFCKNPKAVEAEDFFLPGLNIPGNTRNKVGLIHFQLNVGNTSAVAFAGLSGQNPGVITIANAVFGSNPSISDDVLAMAFQVDKKIGV